MSQAEFADQISVDVDDLDKQEEGKVCLSVEALVKACKEFGVSFESLVFSAKSRISNDPVKLCQEIEVLLAKAESK